MTPKEARRRVLTAMFTTLEMDLVRSVGSCALVEGSDEDESEQRQLDRAARTELDALRRRIDRLKGRTS